MKNLDKLLRLEIITRKDLKEEGYSDYEIKKLVLDGVIEKTGRAMYRSIKEKNTFDDLVDSFNNHDSDIVAKIYDELPDKDKYNGDIIKLLLVSLSRIENILNSGYKLQSNTGTLEKTVELEELNEVVDRNEDNISLESSKENRVEIKDAEVLERKEEVENDFDIDLFLGNLYCEYKIALEACDYYKARDVLVEYNYYCSEYDVDDDCFKELFKVTNKINSLELDERENNSIKFIITELGNEFSYGEIKIDRKKVELLLNQFSRIPSFDNNYYYHKYKALYFTNTFKYSGAIKEYIKAIEINPYSKHDYYLLAWLYHVTTRNKEDSRKALKYMNTFSYYSRNIFSPNQLSLLANIYIFNHMGEKAIEILENAEDYSEEYKTAFFKKFSSMYLIKYDKLKQQQSSNVEVKRYFANSFLKDDYLDTFTKYAFIYSDEFNDIFDDKEKNYQQELEKAKIIIDSNSITKFKELEEYLLNIDLTIEDKVNIMLDVAVYLVEKGFDKESSKYMKFVEKTKDKTDSIKENYFDTQAKVKIKKIANKNRR